MVGDPGDEGAEVVVAVAEQVVEHGRWPVALPTEYSAVMRDAAVQLDRLLADVPRRPG